MSTYRFSGAPGDTSSFKVMLETGKGKPLDITSGVLFAEIYMDIFTGSWTGRVEIDDSVNMITTLPIKAGMGISVSVATDYGGMTADGSKTYSMKIYRIGDLAVTNHNNMQYSILIASDEFIKDQNTRVKQAYKDKPISAIVEELVSNYLGGRVETKASDDPMNVVIPNWSPFTAIAWLSKSAMMNGTADYCFFQKDTGKYAFLPFETMYSSKEHELPFKFKKLPAGRRENGDIDEDVTLLIQDESAELMDTASKGAAGMYSSKTVTFDPIANKWEESNFTFGDDCPKDAENKNFEDTYKPEVNVSYSMAYEAFDKGKCPGQTAAKWMGSRKSSIQKMDSERRFIRLAGSAMSWQWLGKNLIVDLPPEEDLSGEKKDKHRAGRYVIVAIKQHISKAGYSTVVELVKKRLEKD